MRDPHQALDALNVGIARKKVNWILDADIRGFFDHVSHEWLEKFLKHRIADTRVLRLIQEWMKAGVLEEGERLETEQGTPQGAVISPLLAKVYVHYVSIYGQRSGARKWPPATGSLSGTPTISWRETTGQWLKRACWVITGITPCRGIYSSWGVSVGG
jgi:retron-type reverse transcriptase